MENKYDKYLQKLFADVYPSFKQDMFSVSHDLVKDWLPSQPDGIKFWDDNFDIRKSTEYIDDINDKPIIDYSEYLLESESNYRKNITVNSITIDSIFRSGLDVIIFEMNRIKRANEKVLIEMDEKEKLFNDELDSQSFWHLFTC